MSEEDSIWVVYGIDYGSRFVLYKTTTSIWEAMVELKRNLAEQLVAENITFETANKMIGLTEEKQND